MSFAAAGAAATPWLLVASRAHCSVCGAHLASASAWGFPAPAGDASLNMQMSWRTGWMSSYRLIPSGQPAQPAIGCRSSKVCQLQQLCCLLLAARCSLLALPVHASMRAAWHVLAGATERCGSLEAQQMAKRTCLGPSLQSCPLGAPRCLWTLAAAKVSEAWQAVSHSGRLQPQRRRQCHFCAPACQDGERSGLQRSGKQCSGAAAHCPCPDGCAVLRRQ